MRNAQPGCQREPFIDRVDNNRQRPQRQRVLRSQQANLSRAGDGHVFASFDLGLFDCVHGNDQRFSHRYQMPGYVLRYLVQQMARVRNIFRHAALDMHPSHRQVFAAVGMTNRAGITLPTINVGFEDDAVTHAEGLFIGGDFHDFTGDFVADDARVGNQRIHALVGPDIRAADAGTSDLEQDFILAARGFFDFADADFAGLFEQNGFHDFPLSDSGSGLPFRAIGIFEAVNRLFLHRDAIAGQSGREIVPTTDDQRLNEVFMQMVDIFQNALFQ